MSLQDTLDQINNLDLNDIDWSRVGVWPLAGRLVVWLGAIVGVLLLIYFFSVKGLQDRVSSEIAKEAQLKSTLQTKVFQSASLDQYRNQMIQMEKDFAFLLAQLPKKTQVPGLLDDIDEKGRVSGLRIQSVTLKDEVIGEFYVTLPIEIVVDGTYHNMGAFVSGVAGMSRIVTLHDFSINATAGPSNLRMTINAHTYRSIDDEAR